MLPGPSTDARNPTERTGLGAIMMLNYTISADDSPELCFMHGNMASDPEIMVALSLGIVLSGNLDGIYETGVAHIQWRGNLKPGRRGSKPPR